MNRRALACLTAMFLLLSLPALADVPGEMTFSGVLTDENGLPLNETLSVTLNLYDAPTGGNTLWTETKSVAVANGFLNVTVGDTNPLDANLIDGETALYLGVTIGDDEEMSPRQAITSVPYATRAATVESVTGDISPRSVSVGGNVVIDENGDWVGSPSGLQGPQGEQGLIGPAGESVTMWSADAESCPTGGVGFRVGDGDDQFVCNGAQGERGFQGEQGIQGLTGLTGDKGDKGDKGDTGNAGADGLHCWDLDENGSCDVATEDKNGSGTCNVEDCYSAAYEDLSADGRLDFDHADDLVTKGQAEGAFAPASMAAELAAAQLEIANLRTAFEYPNDVVAVGPYLWQKTPTGGAMNWESAMTHCDNLVLAGFDDWRLPTISELRALIRGCAATQTGGSCGVTDSCLEHTCEDHSCASCSSNGGPDAGMYWPAPIEGSSDAYWSSSTHANVTIIAWYVTFLSGRVTLTQKNLIYDARCVR